MKKKDAERLAAWINIAPKMIRIGAYDNAIRFVDGWYKNEKDENCWGVYQPSTRTLTLAIPEDTSQPSEIASTLLHEIMHAIWYERDIGAKAKEEDAIRNLESGLMLFFRQNPAFMGWFLEII